ncbi:Membrane bound O-acyl transferase family domain containing protein, partial [Naviculisporaceae sp. PSN 640]
ILPILAAEAIFLAIFVTVLLRSSPRAMAARFMGTTVLAYITYVMNKSLFPRWLDPDNGNPVRSATVIGYFTLQLLSASELILISRVHSGQLPVQLRTPGGKSTNKPATWREKARSAISLLWDFRRVGTPWQVKNLPAMTSSSSRIQFVLSRLSSAALAYLFLDVITSFPPPDPDLMRADKVALFSPARLARLTPAELGFRAASTVTFWLVSATVNLMITNVVVVFTVILGFADPGDCRPLFGPFREAYTVRRFWGISWHQMLRKVLTGHADLLMDAVLGKSGGGKSSTRSNRLISRYSRLLLAFLISGVHHMNIDRAMGVPAGESVGAVVMWTVHAGAIMLEDATGYLLSSRNVAQGLLKKHPRTRRWLGYLWVLVFLVWSTPVYTYPSMRLGIKTADSLPFRLVGPYVQRAVGV